MLPFGMADTLILRTARQRQRALAQHIAADIRRARLDRGVSQRTLAAAAGMDHAAISRLEAGRTEPTLPVVVALATALGMEPSLRLFPAVGPCIHDRVSAPITDALLGIANERWRPSLEVFVTQPARGVIDVVFVEPRAADVVATEVQGQIRRVEQQLRWAGQKADSLPSAAGWPWTDGPARISRLLVLRSTAETRALVRSLPAVFRTAYPTFEAEAYAALTSPSGRWPGHALLWADLTGGRARILDGSPRSSGR